MDTITTPAGQYTVPATSIVHNAQVSLTDRSPASIVHLTQYDTTMPIIAVDLTANGQQYTVPTGAAVNVRLAKPDGTYVYNPALGVSEDAQTAYIGTTVQMTTVWGRLNAIVEVVLNGAVAGTGIFILDITANPVPESAIESTSEFLTIQQIAAQVQQAADLLEQQSTNLQNLTDNLEAVQNAAANAQAAAGSAEEAKQAAQQALGFRTFFDAISPDENGSLDPSRPMTTAAAQASWTVKSKGDRIQSVQVNGFTADGQSGGLRLYKYTISDATGFSIIESSEYGNAYSKLLGASTMGDDSKIEAFANFLFKPISYNDRVKDPGVFRMYMKDSGTTLTLRASVQDNWSLSDFDSKLKEWAAAGNPLVVWLILQDESRTDGLYIPIQAQGHEYRCQCLPITEALGVGDNVQSNVPSGCDKTFVLDGSQDIKWAESAYAPYGGFFSLPVDGMPQGAVNEKAVLVRSNKLQLVATAQANYADGKMASGVSGNLIFTLFGQKSVEDAKAYLAENPITVYYQSTAYTEQSDIPVSLETHANGNVYAHDPVTLVAVPYTEADVSAAQQLAATPSTLPYIDSADVPMLLNAEDPEQVSPAVLAASAIPVAGTYVVSSQDNTTVLVSLKAFQDGGDAATLGGMTAVEAMLNFVYPVGSIYMSANNVSPQTFLGGTWQQIQGQFLLAASGSYPAGSTGGAAQQTLATENIAAHNHGPAAGERFLSIGGAANGALVSPGTGVMDVEWNANWATADTGSGEPFSIMPPYLAVYMWQRTE